MLHLANASTYSKVDAYRKIEHLHNCVYDIDLLQSLHIEGERCQTSFQSENVFCYEKWLKPIALSRQFNRSFVSILKPLMLFTIMYLVHCSASYVLMMAHRHWPLIGMVTEFLSEATSMGDDVDCIISDLLKIEFFKRKYCYFISCWSPITM